MNKKTGVVIVIVFFILISLIFINFKSEGNNLEIGKDIKSSVKETTKYDKKQIKIDIDEQQKVIDAENTNTKPSYETKFEEIENIDPNSIIEKKSDKKGTGFQDNSYMSEEEVQLELNKKIPSDFSAEEDGV